MELNIFSIRRTQQRALNGADDHATCRGRHLIENVLAKLNKFRAIATYYGIIDASFRANVNIAATIINAR